MLHSSASGGRRRHPVATARIERGDGEQDQLLIRNAGAHGIFVQADPPKCEHIVARRKGARSTRIVIALPRPAADDGEHLRPRHQFVREPQEQVPGRRMPSLAGRGISTIVSPWSAMLSARTSSRHMTCCSRDKGLRLPKAREGSARQAIPGAQIALLHRRAHLCAF